MRKSKSRGSRKNHKEKTTSQFSEIMHRLVRNKLAVSAGIIIAVLVLIAVFAPLLAPYDYAEMDVLNKFQGMSWEHLFGTDAYGRDVFSRILWGARYSLLLGVGATIISTFIGMTFGLLCGYFGGAVDYIIMRFLEIFQSVPNLLLTICISAAFGNGIANTILAMGIGGFAQILRMTRAQVMSIRSMEFLDASKTTNCSVFKIIFKHVLPNSLSPIIICATMSVGHVIMGAAGLSFLGMGVQPPEAEWGAMLVDATKYIQHYPIMTVFPGLMIAITVLAFNMFGDGLRDALDPKLKR